MEKVRISEDHDEESRKTLAFLPSVPSPRELYDLLLSPTYTDPEGQLRPRGLVYKNDMQHYRMRDLALASLLYVAELRVSEAIRLVKDQFEPKPKDNHVYVKNILLSKRKKGKTAYRDARLPLKGEREPFTKLVMDYLETLGPHDRLFPFSLREQVYAVKGHTYRMQSGTVKQIMSFQTVGTKRMYKIVHALLPEFTSHWLRAFGEDFLYDNMDHDIIAVSDEVKVDARTLQQYLRKRNLKYSAA